MNFRLVNYFDAKLGSRLDHGGSGGSCMVGIIVRFRPTKELMKKLAGLASY